MKKYTMLQWFFLSGIVILISDTCQMSEQQESQMVKSS